MITDFVAFTFSVPARFPSNSLLKYYKPRGEDMAISFLCINLTSEFQYSNWKSQAKMEKQKLDLFTRSNPAL